MPQVKSRVNGLIINIPADAAGVVQRFATQGGNELIFEKQKSSGKPQKQKSLVIESEAKDMA